MTDTGVVDQVREVVRLVVDTLGPEVIGIYLHGSAVFGGRCQDAAADWAIAHLPPQHRPVLEHARQSYLDRRYSEESRSDELRARVRPHVDHVRAEIDRLAPR